MRIPKRKRLIYTILLPLIFCLLLPVAFPRYAHAFDILKERFVDDFNRASLGVEVPGNTGEGVEPDDTWVHNPDNFVVYWIQFNATTSASVSDGILTFQSTGEDGWLGFGMTGDFRDPDYDSFSVRLRGERGGEEAGLYFNINGAFDFRWENARDPDGNPLPPITTEFQTYVISLENSGFGATRAQRNYLTNGWSDFHINSSGGPLTVYIDEIKQIQTHPYHEPVAPATPTPEPPPEENPPSETEVPPEESLPEGIETPPGEMEPTPEENPPGETEPASEENPPGEAEITPTPENTGLGDNNSEDTPDETGGDGAPAEIYPETDRPLDNSFLVDDFNRASLMLDPELEIWPGGEFGQPNTDGNVVYWIQFNEQTTPVIEAGGVLKLTAAGSGWYGTATDLAFTDEYNCVAFRIKGENGGEETALTFNPDTLGSKTFAELIGPDGNPVPPITAEWQTIVVDIAKSGWPWLADGKQSYQNIHLNTNGPLTVYIDEIYFTQVASENTAEPLPAEVSGVTEPAVSAEPGGTPPAETDTAAPTAKPTPPPLPEPPFDTGRLILAAVLALIIIGAVTGIIFLFNKKDKKN
jgi:hypothetical protein